MTGLQKQSAAQLSLFSRVKDCFVLFCFVEYQLFCFISSNTISPTRQDGVENRDKVIGYIALYDLRLFAHSSSSPRKKNYITELSLY